MKWLTRGLGLTLLGLGMVAGIGCGNENEAAFNKQFANSDATQIKEPVTSAPANPADWGKQTGGGTAGGYPGQKGSPKPKAK
jgi:hypothetical protein